VDKVTPRSRRKDVEIFPLTAIIGPEPLSQGKAATSSSLYGGAYAATKAFDGDESTRWAVANGQKTGWLAVDLGQEATVSRAVIQEISWPSVTQFAIQAKDASGNWQDIASGTTIGSRLELKFKPVKARYFRLDLRQSSNMPNIEEFQLFDK
jgi:hypothetical protein